MQRLLKYLGKVLNKNIKGKLKIEIKRGCTEYGIEHPNYKVLDETSNDFMRYNNEWKKKKILLTVTNQNT